MVQGFNWFNLFRSSIGQGFNWSGFICFKLLIESRVQLDSARVILVEGLNQFKCSIDSIGLRVKVVNWLQWFNMFQGFKLAKDSNGPRIQQIQG